MAPEDFSGVPLGGSFSLVRELLRDRAVLDLGCNRGYYLRFGGPGSAGLDVSPDNVAACRAEGLDVRQHDLNRLPLPLPDEAFDVVLLSHTLEHVHAPLLLLREANRVLRGGGCLIVGLPIEDSLYSRLRMDYYGGPEGHIYSFSRGNLRKLFAVTGFVEESLYLNVPVLGFRPWPRLNRLAHRLPAALLYQLSGAYWSVARKRGAPAPDDGFSSYFRER